MTELKTTREIWEQLHLFHEGTTQMKAKLFETHQRGYGNFTHKPGDSLDPMFSRFQSIVNNIRAIGTLSYCDHEQAVKLFYVLDRSVWDMKLNSIIELA